MKRDVDFTDTNYESAKPEQIEARMKDLPEFEVAEVVESEHRLSGELVKTVDVNYTEDEESNFKQASEAMSRLAEKTESIVDELVSLARTSESARVYEVLAQHVKITADLHKDAMDIMERKAKLAKMKGDAIKGDQPTINNPQQINIYSGSTADIIKMITDATKAKE